MALGPKQKPLRTVSHVDLASYAGRWHEIARYPNRFQKNCLESQATYTLQEDGRVAVLNQCRDKSSPGTIRSVKGKAWVVDKQTNAKLKVSFFWPFAGDYWIIDLGANYDYAVVGHPERRYLWILCREKEMEEEKYRQILARLADQEYDLSKIIKTANPRRRPTDEP